jgi:hypothetical protein
MRLYLDLNFDKNYVLHLARLRQIIEPINAKLAAQNRTDAQLAILEENLGHFRDHDQTPDALAKLDVDFHRNIAHATGNPITSTISTGRPNVSRQLMGNVTFKPNSSDKLQLLYNYDGIFGNGITSNYFRWFERVLNVTKETSTTHQIGLAWNKIFSPSTFLDVKVSQQFTENKEMTDLLGSDGLTELYTLNTYVFTDKFSPYRNPNFDPSDPSQGGFYDQSLAGQEKTALRHVFQPRIGISFPVSDRAVLHLNYGVFTQRPAFEFIFVNRLKLETNPNYDRLGNPALKPEKTISCDVGLVHALPLGFYLDVNAYLKDVSNLIQFAVYEDNGGFRPFANQPRHYRFGIEFDF